ncbi:DNA-binding protein YbaB [Saccharopolyspora erythraea NRRL 2338]|uniref:YbaB/EbfC DNA-binding family protein n=1 Tax=Saccharopolyspora erythraea TaxID=1836 RepID=A0ABP3M4V4_SACER|nr:YbaB/EbfC family nucleoid-associated protein [Saccharopolyspora erythraea]PFG98716.1 DNA-binding protein YbaB [Saccharopolyspora erythraea NRRL 2338]
MNRVGDIQRRANDVQEQIRGMRAEVGSPDGAVSVVLAPGGRLERLTIAPQAMRLGHERLSALITETVAKAHGAAAQQVQAAMQPLVGGTAAMDFLREQIQPPTADDGTAGPGAAPTDRGSAPPAAPQTPRQPHRGWQEEDDDFDEPGGSFLR